jgi:hypothetical protein
MKKREKRRLKLREFGGGKDAGKKKSRAKSKSECLGFRSGRGQTL